MSTAKKWGIAFGISVASCIISIILMRDASGYAAEYVGPFGFLIGGVLSLFCGFMFLGYSVSEKNEKEKEEFDAVASFNYVDTLYLKKRSSVIQKRVKIVEDRNVVTAYNPKQTHIGAVSVGGVVSGGTYTTGGNYYVAHSEKNGRYKLVYSENDKSSSTINKIQLTDELFQQAKNSSIKEYLDEKKKQIVVVSEVYLSGYDMMWKMANLQTGNFGLTEAEKAGYPSYEKCQAILNWICR